MSRQRERREAIPAERDGWERERAAWQRAEERAHWMRYQRERGKALGEMGKRTKREWSELYGRQEREREKLGQDCRGVLGRLRAWRELGEGVREIGGALRGRAEVLERFRAELESRQRGERVTLGKVHAEAVRGIELEAGGVYRRGREGAEERAWEAVRTGGRSLSYDPDRPVDRHTLGRWVLEERMEQVREVEGEKAYESMKQVVEWASQREPYERASWSSSSEPERSSPERDGPERDSGPSR